MTLSLRKVQIMTPGSAPDWTLISRKLRQVANALTGSVDQAEELTQQTLATLLAKNSGRADHLGYARQTLVRLWLDTQRSLRRRLARWARVALHSSSQTAESDGLEVNELAERVRDAVDRLPPRQRAILVLRVIESLDYDQIADTLGCSVQTVRANLHLARQRVRTMIGEQP